ncbi:MAG: type II secretion system F family protein [Acidimicrobiia bacterium]
MKQLRRLVAAATVAILVLGAGSAALAQTENSAPVIEITDVNIARYPRVQMIVDFLNLEEALDPAQLQVTENGNAVSDLEIETIAESRVQVGIVLVIDASGSMEGPPIEAAKAAALSFINQKRAEDFIAVATFADDVQVVRGFTNTKSTLVASVQGIAAGGDTAFYDGIIRSTELFSGDAARLERNMIVLTDGKDEGSVASLDDALAAVADNGVRVFGVALESAAFDPVDLQTVVSASNGLYLSTPEPGALSGLYDQIKRELDNKVVVRFNATQDRAGDLAIGVGYQTLATNTTVSVPGFIKPPPPTTTTTVTYAQPEPYSPAAAGPVSVGTLRFLGTLAVGLGIVLFIIILAGPSEEDGASAFRKRLQAYGRGRTAPEEEKKGFLARIPGLSRFTKSAEEAAQRRGLLNGINAVLEQANIPLRAGEALAAGLGLSVIAGVVAGLFARSTIAAGVGFLFVLLLVAAAIQFAGTREKRVFERQLPDTLTLLSTSLRAGYSLLQAVEAVAAEAPQPTGREFGRSIAESRLGRPVVDTMQAIAERMRSQDFQWAVMAIEIQREVGGNLAEVLQTVADTMRQRNRLKGEIRALTAEGRLSAIVLALLPVVLFAFLYTTNRGYLEPLFSVTAGLIAIGAGLGLMGAGIYWLKKIVDIEV